MVAASARGGSSSQGAETKMTDETRTQNGTESTHCERITPTDGQRTSSRILADGGVIWSDLNAFQRDTLEAIARIERDDVTPYGLKIKDEIECDYSDPINHGRLYPNLDTLVQKGLISKEKKDGRTNTYTLSRRGRDEIKSRDEWNADHAPAGTDKNLKRPA